MEKKTVASVKNIYLDIGDIYTKMIVLDDSKNIEYDLCFPSKVKNTAITEETSSYCMKSESDIYQVGWEAAYKCSYNEIVNIKCKPSVAEIFNKILFDYIDDRARVNLNLIVDNDEIIHQAKRLEDIFGSCKYCISGFINGVQITKQFQIKIAHYPASEILEKYFRKLLGRKKKKATLIIDLGFKQTKLFIIDYTHNNVSFHKLPHGFDYYFIKLSEQLSDSYIRLHPFLTIMELERGNSTIETSKGKHDASKLMENIRHDLNKLIVNETEIILKKFYESYLIWPDYLYITGGGAIENGDAINKDLSKRIGHFKKTEIEFKPRGYLVKKGMEVI